MAEFDQRQGSSDGGAILLKAADRRLGVDRPVGCLLGGQAAGGQVGEALAHRVIERHRRRLHARARRVTIDLDPTHGAQQLSFFNAHYDRWCYLPVAGFPSFNVGMGKNPMLNRLAQPKMDRTSCWDFWANQFRVLMTAAAYVLMQELRLRAARTECARAQVWILRERLLKLGARVRVSVRRVVLHLPVSFPFLNAFHRVALALGARAG